MATERTFETFGEHLTEALRDQEFREAWEASEPTYQVARLRILRGLTQIELARRVAQALGARLEVRIVPLEEAPAAG